MPSLNAQKLPPPWGPDPTPVRHQHVADAVEAALAQIRALQLEVAYIGRRHALQQGIAWSAGVQQRRYRACHSKDSMANVGASLALCFGLP